MANGLRVGLYARVSTHDQQTLPMQLEAMHAYVAQRGWNVVMQIEDVGSGSIQRPKRDALLRAARRRDVDAVLVWRLDRWGRSVADLMLTLKELNELGVGFVSLTEALDLTTSTGRAMAGLLAVFADYAERFYASVLRLVSLRPKQGRRHGRPRSAAWKADQVQELFANGISKTEIARRLSIGRTSVRRILAAPVYTSRKTNVEVTA